MDRLSEGLDRLMRVMLLAVALAVFVGAAVMIVNIDRRELLSRLIVAVIATLALGGLDGRYRWLQGRRYLLVWGPEEPAYYRSILISFALVLCAGAALIGLALSWP